jgi:hypothetical protein
VANEVVVNYCEWATTQDLQQNQDKLLILL